MFGPGDSPVGSSVDTITDFSHAQADQIDLHLIDAINGGADDAFSFIGSAAFSHTAGELHYTAVSGGIMVSGDTNGDGVADFQFKAGGIASLSSSDFIL